MDLTAARSSIFGAYLEDTAQKLAEARQREAFILVKGLILKILLNPLWLDLSCKKPSLKIFCDLPWSCENYAQRAQYFRLKGEVKTRKFQRVKRN